MSSLSATFATQLQLYIKMATISLSCGTQSSFSQTHKIGNIGTDLRGFVKLGDNGICGKRNGTQAYVPDQSNLSSCPQQIESHP